MLHFRAVPPNDDGAVRSPMVEPPGGLDIGLSDRGSHRRSLEGRNLAWMTCAALFLRPAGECAANQHGNAHRDHAQRPYGEKPHVSNSRYYSTWTRLHLAPRVVQKSHLRRPGLESPMGRDWRAACFRVYSTISNQARVHAARAKQGLRVGAVSEVREKRHHDVRNRPTHSHAVTGRSSRNCEIAGIQRN